jgi:hypothetical protein
VKNDQKIFLCEICRANAARRYELYSFSKIGEPTDPRIHWLCVKCARHERQSIQRSRQAQPPDLNDSTRNQITRAGLIAALDRFWAESGAGEICRQCHEQGTGCCPPMCRHLGANGCLKKNVFCTSFVCSALLNAIAECNLETGRLLKWIKQNPGAAEFRIYEMVTRVPAIDREIAYPLVVPDQYPGPLNLSGKAINGDLQALTQEVLEIRRRWRQEELGQLKDAVSNDSLKNV